MVRYRGKKALYEVMSGAKVKADKSRTITKLHPENHDVQEKSAGMQSSGLSQPTTTTHWWKKPRIIQLNSGRVELSIPYQIAVVLVLVFVLLLILCYRAGQSAGSVVAQEQADNNSERASGGLAVQPMANTQYEQTTSRTTTEQPPVTNAGSIEDNTTEEVGNNVLVIASYRARADLIPVVDFFKEYGIMTEIVMSNDWYYLQTVQRFVNNPSTPGSEGYQLMKRIAEIGKNYKAPSGLETFASHYFSDAYGKKVN